MGNGEVVLFGLNVVVGTNGVVVGVVVVLVVLKNRTLCNQIVKCFQIAFVIKEGVSKIENS